MTPTLSTRLRDATRGLHAEVERSGLMHRLLAGRLPRAGYCRLLRSLQPVYVALEAGLDHHAADPRIAGFRLPGLPRAAALAQDLHDLHGADWSDTLAPAPSVADYVARLQVLANGPAPLLAAHVYVRYLGDLHGGQILRRIVAGSLGQQLPGPAGSGLAFYDFGGPDLVAAHIVALRAALDALAEDEPMASAIVDEAVGGFERHRRLFNELDPG